MKDISHSQLTVMPYLTLARELSALLTPVLPREEFRAELYQRLIASARQPQTHRVLLKGAPDGERANQGLRSRMSRWVTAAPVHGNRRWALGAAAVGSAVSLAGLFAYTRRRRVRRAA